MSRTAADRMTLSGELGTAPVQTTADRWRIMDIDGKSMGEGAVVDGQNRVLLGKLGVG